MIIGLLIGTILTEQEFISSGRTRSLIDSTSAVQTAYYGFIDRYRRVPGDWNATAASAGIGVPITGGGNDNRRMTNPPGAAVYDEANALWEQLSSAHFLRGAFDGTPGLEPDVSNRLAPTNGYLRVMTIGLTSDYLGVNPVRLNMSVGRGAPARILYELDLKLDDGLPGSGRIRATKDDVNIGIFTGRQQLGWK